MIIQKLELRNFRNYDQLTLRPMDGINLFFGSNGSGKTNLLEAIHYCALGKSHRVNNDQNVVRLGQREASCALTVKKDPVRNEIRVLLQPGEANRKTVWIDQAKVRRFSELMGCFRCVLFSPEDLGMLRGGPSLRRRFLDMMISQWSPAYFIALQQYRTAMEHRNAILKECRLTHTNPGAMIGDFEGMMASSALVIMAARREIIATLSRHAEAVYHRLSGREEECFRMDYHCSMRNVQPEEEALCRVLRDNREEDERTGLTSQGPHRDDLTMTLNQKDIRLFASQGQVRSAALSLRLSQLSVMEEQGRDRPVLLLDDVMSELDQSRRMNLLREIQHTQTFITCSDENDVAEFLSARVYSVRTEGGLAQLSEARHGEGAEEAVLREPDFT